MMHIAGEIKQKLWHIGDKLEPLSYWWSRRRFWGKVYEGKAKDVRSNNDDRIKYRI